MVLQILFIVIVPTLLVAAAMWDLTSYTIPNVFPAALILLFFAFVALTQFGAHPMSLADIGWHGAAFGIALVAGLLFFALGWIGGGDAKLFAAAALWLGWDVLFQYAIYAALFGGGLTLGLLIFRKIAIPAPFLHHAWLVRLNDQRSGIPYGVALGLAAVMLVPSSPLFHLAATA